MHTALTHRENSMNIDGGLLVEGLTEEELLRRSFEDLPDIGPSGGNIRVVFIDDSAADQAIVGRHLGAVCEWDVQLTCFNNLESAWETLQDGPIDVLLVDYMIGAETGLSAPIM